MTRVEELLAHHPFVADLSTARLQGIGWSWLTPPYKRHVDARAFSRVTAVALDGPTWRRLFEENPKIGCRFLRRMTQVLAERLQATRLQILDVYQAAT